MAHPSGPRASFLRRFAALFLDGIVLGIVAAILQAFLARSISDLLVLGLGIAYYGYLEGSPSGQTVGKRALGIRVIDLKGSGPIGTSRGVLRYFARILSTIVFLLGYFWMLWDPEKQTWHDKIAGSVVVPVSAFPVDSWPGKRGESLPTIQAPSETPVASDPAAESSSGPKPETLEEEQQRKFSEREKQWGG
jgi:uncharacterized RDD family membrane protein YckC